MMTKLTANLRQGGEAAGKRPTRVPKRTSSSPTPDARRKRKRRNPSKQPSAHRMTTRSRAKSFQFMNLPAELRNLIYEYAFITDQPLDLRIFKLPGLLSVSRTMREEAMPLFFAASIFSTAFRSNWCVKNRHWHSADYLRHYETGILNGSALLPGGALGLPQAAVRFHNVNFTISCVCCPNAREIGTVQLRVCKRKPVATVNGTSTIAETRLAWIVWDQEVKREVAAIPLSEQFNGFATADLRAIAMCFRYTPD